MKRNSGGFIPTIHGGETVHSFVPADLPPSPALVMSSDLQNILAEANQAIGRLDGLSIILPDTALFLYVYIRKEAVLSSQIEGTQSSLSDLLVYESQQVPGVPTDDVQEVLRYVRAIEFGLNRVRVDDFPLSARLMREMHEILLSGGRGENKSPGEFRTSQNWIGGTRPGNAIFVPPPPGAVADCVTNLERYIHNEFVHHPTLIKAALIHLQFETIHPFLDGNGRLGRLLITLLLCVEGVLQDPLLYLSLYLKENRDEYYRLLQYVRDTGDWEAWLKFFLLGVKQTAMQAVGKAQEIVKLFSVDREHLEAVMGKSAGSAVRIQTHLKSRPVTSAKETSKATGLSQPAVNKTLDKMCGVGIVKEVTGQKRNKRYIYQTYLDVVTAD